MKRLLLQYRLAKINTFRDNAIAQILKAHEKSFKRGDLTIMHQSWSSFVKLRRGIGEKIDYYVGIEKKMAELKRGSIVLPSEVLAMQLFDAAKVSNKEIQIVFTGVNYKEDIEMHDQSKRTLRNFFGEQVVSHSTLMREDVNAVEGAHYTNSRGRFQSSRGKHWGRGRRGFLRNMKNTSTGYKQGFKYNGR